MECYYNQAAAPFAWILQTPNEQGFENTFDTSKNVNKLKPIYTKERKSAFNSSSISFIPLTFEGHHFYRPQDTKHVIFEGAAQRGGLNTSNIIKNAWSSEYCNKFISPQKACDECSYVDGYRVKEDKSVWGKTKPGSFSQKMVTSHMASALGSSRQGQGPQFLNENKNFKFPIISDPYDRYPIISGNEIFVPKIKNYYPS